MVRPEPHQPFAETVTAGHRHALPQHQLVQQCLAQFAAATHALGAGTIRARPALGRHPFALCAPLLLHLRIQRQVIAAPRQSVEGCDARRGAQLRLQPTTRILPDAGKIARTCARAESIGRRCRLPCRHGGAPCGTHSANAANPPRVDRASLRICHPPLPATVIRPTRIEPVRRCERGSTSLPTASMPANMALRLPAIVIPSTG